MKLTEFLRHLEHIRGDWCVASPFIRRAVRRSGMQCPITAVYSRVKKRRLDVCYWKEAGIELGLSEALVDRLNRAADSKVGEPRLRRRILKALDLATFT